jgi:cyclase
MLKSRIIPILTYNGIGLVKTKQFQSNPRMVGNPIQAAKVFNARCVDELVFIDIYASIQNRKPNLKIIKLIADQCFMPVSVGGGISSLEDINKLLDIGADKVIIKSQMIEDPSFVDTASKLFGEQCIALSLDVINENSIYYTYHNGFKIDTLDNYLDKINLQNFGELILTSVNNDGMMNGFDIELIKIVEKKIKVPIIVAGGAGNPSHFKNLFLETNIEAVAASSIFYFTQFTPLDIKKELLLIGKPVRMT